MTLHARVPEGCYSGHITTQIKDRLHQRFDVQHATVESNTTIVRTIVLAEKGNHGVTNALAEQMLEQ